MRTIRAHSLVVFLCLHVRYNSLVTRTVLYTRLAGVFTKQLSVLPLSEKTCVAQLSDLVIEHTRVPQRRAPNGLDRSPRREQAGASIRSPCGFGRASTSIAQVVTNSSCVQGSLKHEPWTGCSRARPKKSRDPAGGPGGRESGCLER